MRTHKSLHTFSIHGGTLFALVFGLGLPACDGVDEGSAEVNADTDTDANTDSAADAEVATPGAGLPLVAPVDPQAAGNYPTFEIGAPFRVEDFKPDDSGVSPLARHEEWYYTPCPNCGARSCITSQCSAISPSSTRKMSITAQPRSPGQRRTW